MAGAGFKTFNTGDVFTASDANTYLMQQTVMVFADAAARTTALGANVSEGMLSYLKSTKQVEVYNGSAWVASDDPNAIQNTIVDAKGDLISATANDTPARLAVGTNGQVLTADSSTSTGLKWADSASGGMTLISTTTLSGASVTLSSIPQTYVRLILYVYSMTNNTADGKLAIKPKDAAGSRFSGTDYNAVYSSSGSVVQTNAVLSRTNPDNGFTMIIDNYTSSTAYVPTFQLIGYYYDGTNPRAINIGGTTQNAPIDSIVITNAGGTFSGGTAKLYGVK